MSPAMVAGLCLGYAPRLGEIRFCRVSHDGLVGLVPRGCIVEVDPAAEGAAFMGSTATLVVNASGWRVFPASDV